MSLAFGDGRKASPPHNFSKILVDSTDEESKASKARTFSMRRVLIILKAIGCREFVSHSWPTQKLTSVEKIIDLLDALQGKRCLNRGQSNSYGSLIPSIDRCSFSSLSRKEKLNLERKGIETFRSTARNFSSLGEREALHDDTIALMVLRHYEVPTRLLDWSASPYVAAYFACNCKDTKDGEIWCFDEPRYEVVGRKQWKWWPQTTSDNSGDHNKFEAGLTAFTVEEPPDWFICAFYKEGFPRQLAQKGAYTMTANFNRDHAESIANLFGNDTCYYNRYVVKSALKPDLREVLRKDYGIWRGSLFPDSAGAAKTAESVMKSQLGICPIATNEHCEHEE